MELSRNARRVYVAATLGLAAVTGISASVYPAQPAFAQEQCKKLKGFGDAALCEIQRNKTLVGQLKKADEQIAESDKAIGCIDRIKIEIAKAKQVGPLTPGQIRDFTNKVATCNNGGA
jgi:hypothetical protein